MNQVINSQTSELIGIAMAQYAVRTHWSFNEDNKCVAVTVFGGVFPNKGFTEQVEGDPNSTHRRMAALAKALGAMVTFIETETTFKGN